MVTKHEMPEYTVNEQRYSMILDAPGKIQMLRIALHHL
jgi:hypothetical protein